MNNIILHPKIKTYSLVLVLFSPVVLNGSIWTFVGSSNVDPSGAGILETISVFRIVRQTLDSHRDFFDCNTILLPRGEVVDLIFEQRQEFIRISSGGQIAIFTVRSTKFYSGRHGRMYRDLLRKLRLEIGRYINGFYKIADLSNRVDLLNQPDVLFTRRAASDVIEFCM